MIVNSKLIVTSYKNPDLDGVACIFAYAEFLCKQGKNTIPVIAGKPHIEAKFVLDKFNIVNFTDIENIKECIKEVILVDTSDLRTLSGYIRPNQVIEIIDHRLTDELTEFPNATINIELVGSAATLIAEKFYESNTPISTESAWLLYSAIISNTINFQSKVTTSRDKNMASWLKDKIQVLSNYINKMFMAKSNFSYLLKETIFDECAIFNINNQKIGISQLEILNASLFVKENLSKIKAILSSIKTSQSLDIIFLSLIDVEHAFNILIVLDQTSQNLIEKILKLKFKNSISKTENIIMRKEIIPLIREYLQS